MLVWLAGLALLAALLCLAWVPDTAVVRAKVSLGRSLLLVSAGLLVVSGARRGALNLPWAGFLAASLGPGLLALLHPLHSEPASHGLARDEIARLLLLPLTVWLVADLARGERGRGRLVLALALATAGVAGWAVIERVGWLPEVIAPHARTRAGFGNPVFLGAWLVLLVPTCLAEGLLRPGPGRWLAALAAGLGIPAILATGSAGALVGLGVSVVLLVVLLVGRSRWLMIILGGVAALGALVLGTRLGLLLRPRAHDLIWRDTLQMVLDHPSGVGPGQFQLAFLPYASEELLDVYPRELTIVNDAHNEPLQVLAELGWVGFLALVVAALWLGRASLGALARQHADRHRLAAAAAAVGGALAQSLVSPDLRFSVTFMTLGLLVGLMASFDVTPSTWRPKPATCALLMAVGLGLLVLAARDAWHIRERLDLVDRPASSSAAGDTTTAEALAAVDAARAALARRPDDPGAHFDLGTALSAAGRHQESVEAFGAALALRPANPSIVRNLGIVEHRAGMHVRAMEHLEAALAHDPDDTLVRVLLGWSTLHTGSPTGAAVHARTLLDAQPGQPDARYLLAYAAFVMGDVRTAMVEVEALLERYPRHDKARLLHEVLSE